MKEFTGVFLVSAEYYGENGSELARDAGMGRSETVFQTIDFEEMLVLKRKRSQIGLPVNHMCNSGIATRGYDNELAILSPVRPGGKLRTLFHPSGSRFVSVPPAPDSAPDTSNRMAITFDMAAILLKRPRAVAKSET